MLNKNDFENHFVLSEARKDGSKLSNDLGNHG